MLYFARYQKFDHDVRHEQRYFTVNYTLSFRLYINTALVAHDKFHASETKTSFSHLWILRTVSNDNHYDVGMTSCARMCSSFRVVNRLCTRIGVVLGVGSYTVLDAVVCSE
jgi:hypothetical protein